MQPSTQASGRARGGNGQGGADEDKRLAELHALDALNVGDDPLVGFTELCTRIFGAPAAFVSFTGKHQTWIKGVYGPVDLRLQSDPIETLCTRTVHGGDVTVVPDVAADPHVPDPAQGDGAPVRFFAGAVVTGRNGEALGALCVVDVQPREFGEREREILVGLATLVRRELLRLGGMTEKQSELVRAEVTDSLTGLPNRRLLWDRLQQEVQKAGGDTMVLLLWIDVARFGDFVAAHSTKAGEKLLAAQGRRLVDALPGASAVGRWQADRFVAIVPGLSRNDDLHGVVQPVKAALGEPLSMDGQPVQVSARIGVCSYPDDASNAAELLANARRMAQSLTPGSNEIAFAVHDKTLNAQLSASFDMERRLRVAMDTEALSLVFQPEIGARDGRIAAAEALLRWWDPVLGSVPPSTFIPLAEASGLIYDLDRRVMEWACREAAAWTTATGREVEIAVNVSAYQLQQPHFVDDVIAALEASGLPPERLVIELTENALIKDAERVLANMNALVDLEVGFAIDDFGTGYASFAYIQRLPLRYLKLDRSFVRQVADRDHDARIVESIIGLGHTLDLTVIAEGLETSEQERYLIACGCDQLQGFRYGYPMPAADLRQKLWNGRG